jgi:hypothetical protein
MKLKALNLNHPESKVKWLTIESDENETKGFFVFYHLNEHSAYDTWHQSLDEAFAAAYDGYNISKDAWTRIKN